MNSEHLYFNILNQEYQPYQPQLWQELKSLKSFKALYEKHKDRKLLGIDSEKEWSKVEKLGLRVITYLDEEYPPNLKNISTPPLGFYLLGRLPLNFPLAIVGTRKAGHYGLNIAQRFASSLSHLGATIVSGLAYGIDCAAHQGTIEAGGKTIAVLGEGIDLVLNSPKRNLIDKILGGGSGIISEFPLGTPGYQGNFPLRNRIIAGLSLGVLVIEAPIDSGALITARCALEQNREVFVVPAELNNKNFTGSHRLIQQGAKLVTCIEDILTEFDFASPLAEADRTRTTADKLKFLNLSPKEEEIYETLKSGDLTLMELQEKLDLQKLDLPTGELLSLLTHMEIRGIIKNIGGRFVTSF